MSARVSAGFGFPVPDVELFPAKRIKHAKSGHLQMAGERFHNLGPLKSNTPIMAMKLSQLREHRGLNILPRFKETVRVVTHKDFGFAAKTNPDGGQGFRGERKQMAGWIPGQDRINFRLADSGLEKAPGGPQGKV